MRLAAPITYLLSPTAFPGHEDLHLGGRSPADDRGLEHAVSVHLHFHRVAFEGADLHLFSPHNLRESSFEVRGFSDLDAPEELEEPPAAGAREEKDVHLVGLERG